jgi:hypothetical protein
MPISQTAIGARKVAALNHSSPRYPTRPTPVATSSGPMTLDVTKRLLSTARERAALRGNIVATPVIHPVRYISPPSCTRAPRQNSAAVEARPASTARLSATAPVSWTSSPGTTKTRGPQRSTTAPSHGLSSSMNGARAARSDMVVSEPVSS